MSQTWKENSWVLKVYADLIFTRPVRFFRESEFLLFIFSLLNGQPGRIVGSAHWINEWMDSFLIGRESVDIKQLSQHRASYRSLWSGKHKNLWANNVRNCIYFAIEKLYLTGLLVTPKLDCYTELDVFSNG